jgi:DNA anti-recombination protein RmuC
MKKESKELQKIKGIRGPLLKRLIDAGYDTFDKIAAAGDAGLKKIRGLDQLTRKSVIDQAASLAKENRKKARRLKDLKTAAATVRGQVEGLAHTVKDRLGDRLTEKGMGKLEKQLFKMTAALDKAKGKLESRVKPAAKGLAKAKKQLAVTADKTTEPTEVITRLKKARKAIKKIYSR